MGQRRGDQRMARTENLLANLERPLQGRLGRGQIPTGRQHQGRQVVQALRHVGMIAAPGVLEDRDATLEHRSRLVELAEGAENASQVVESGAHRRMVGTVMPFLNGDASLQQRTGLLVVTPDASYERQVLQPPRHLHVVGARRPAR